MRNFLLLLMWFVESFSVLFAQSPIPSQREQVEARDNVRTIAAFCHRRFVETKVPPSDEEIRAHFAMTADHQGMSWRFAAVRKDVFALGLAEDVDAWEADLSRALGATPLDLSSICLSTTVSITLVYMNAPAFSISGPFELCYVNGQARSWVSTEDLIEPLKAYCLSLAGECAYAELRENRFVDDEILDVLYRESAFGSVLESQRWRVRMAREGKRVVVYTEDQSDDWMVHELLECRTSGEVADLAQGFDGAILCFQLRDVARGKSNRTRKKMDAITILFQSSPSKMVYTQCPGLGRDSPLAGR